MDIKTWKAPIIFSMILVSAIALAEEIKIAVGATAMGPIFTPIKQPFETATSIKLVYPGPKEGLPGDEVFKMVDQGKVDGGVSGTPFDEWIKIMKVQKKYPIADEGLYKRRVIGYDHIQIITSNSLGVSSLTQEQIKGIFSGKIANWKDVGGPDRAIVIVRSSMGQPSTENFFKKAVLEGAEFSTRNTKDVPDLAKFIKMVAASKSAIGFCPMGAVDSSVFVPKIPTIGRPITFITKGPPSPKVLKLLEFIQGEGRKYENQ